MTRGALLRWIQFLVSAGLVVLLLRRVPLGDLGAAAARLSPVPVALAILLSLLAYLGRAYRWRVLLARVGVRLPMAAAYRLTLVGTAYGIVTPGRVGEFARILHLDAPRSRMLASAVWDRIADVVLLEVLCVPAFLAIPAWRGGPLAALLAALAATLAGAWLLDHPPAFRRLAARLPALRGVVERYGDASSGTIRDGAFWTAFPGGVFYYLLVYSAAFLLVRDLAPGASPRVLLGLPVIPLVGNLPVALGGLGLRENVSATVFTQFGLAAAQGAVFSLAWFGTTTLVPGLAGLALNLASPGRRPAATSGGVS